ncbi:dTDP-4-dehydrorhamnose reductase [Ichthyenterobacterium sp. W332]|uniref:dTDP-4-dehydrorhamnose reductase n=1 Tax=Microcosmobacter mediterraneus TaxID=3075607 RepID=A0ABU2YIP2_9FLAO|nr:dTDP-4-dehydrorhamnose reductase [Ichthyenterobacterium sp. W332]MDT0558048.1 dTDP-4-dehydrorhamnose reductase [Ichthyenterobacterium sp. W332]
MNTILITGGDGQLGQCLKILSNNFPNINYIFKNSRELDITNSIALTETFKNSKINWVVNCAAYTAVDKAESEPERAKAINTTAVKEIAKCCKMYNAKLIHISTDFIFNGKKKFPYEEKDKTGPINIYGKTKLDGEEEIIKILTEYYIIRTSWLYSEFANNFMKTMLRLAQNRKEINIVSDQIGTPTYAKDLAEVILTIIVFKSEHYGIYHYSNEGIASWDQFAREIFKIKNLPIRINQVTSEEYKTPAKRPSFSVLNKSKIKKYFNIEIPNWKDSLMKALSNYEQ